MLQAIDVTELFTRQEIRSIKGVFSSAAAVSIETLGQSNSTHPHTLTYCDSVHHARRADRNPCVVALITTEELATTVTRTPCVIVADRPRSRFFAVHEWLCAHALLTPAIEGGRGVNCRVHSSAIVSPHARIGDRVCVGAGAIIGDCVDIGADSRVEAGVQVGAEGLLYQIDSEGDKHFVPHQGGVIVGEFSALLSNAVVVRSVHRGLMTRIGNHSLIGIATTIGHEAQVASNVVVSNHSVVARGAVLRDHSFVGTTSVIREYVTLAEHATVKAGSIVVSDVGTGETVSGNYAENHRDHLRRHLGSTR